MSHTSNTPANPEDRRNPPRDRKTPAREPVVLTSQSKQPSRAQSRASFRVPGGLQQVGEQTRIESPPPPPKEEETGIDDPTIRFSSMAPQLPGEKTEYIINPATGVSGERPKSVLSQVSARTSTISHANTQTARHARDRELYEEQRRKEEAAFRQTLGSVFSLSNKLSKLPYEQSVPHSYK